MNCKIYFNLHTLKHDIFDINDAYKNIKFLNFENIVSINKFAEYPELYLTMWDDTIFCGIMKVICLNDYVNYPAYLRTCMYISVHNLYQHKGIAKKLITEYFNFCKKNHINDMLYLSPYTNIGKQYLQHIFNNYKKLINENINNFIG